MIEDILKHIKQLDEMIANNPLPWSNKMIEDYGEYTDKRLHYSDLLNEARLLLLSSLPLSDKPHEYLTAEERFAKYGKSPMMLAQEHAAKDLIND